MSQSPEPDDAFTMSGTMGRPSVYPYAKLLDGNEHRITLEQIKGYGGTNLSSFRESIRRYCKFRNLIVEIKSNKDVVSVRLIGKVGRASLDYVKDTKHLYRQLRSWHTKHCPENKTILTEFRKLLEI